MPEKNVQQLPKFLSEREVANLTGLSTKTLQRWRLLGMGPTYRKLGAAVRYGEIDILQWIASSPAGGGSPRHIT